jgi:hypothetical protein
MNNKNASFLYHLCLQLNKSWLSQSIQMIAINYLKIVTLISIFQIMISLNILMTKALLINLKCWIILAISICKI